MTRLFLEDGESVPVTAVSVCGNFLADIKTTSRDGYNAFVVSKVNKSNNVNKSQSEFYKKINLEPGILAEFRSTDEIADDMKVGKHLTADIFEIGQYVDVTGTSKGKGYAGVIKRHILLCKMQLMVTPYLIEHMGQLGSVKHQEECGKVKKCQGIWATNKKLSKA